MYRRQVPRMGLSVFTDQMVEKKEREIKRRKKEERLEKCSSKLCKHTLIPCEKQKDNYHWTYESKQS